LVGSSLNYCNEKHGFINFIFILAFAFNKPSYDYRRKYVEANQVIQYTKSWIKLPVQGGVLTKSKFTLSGGCFGLRNSFIYKHWKLNKMIEKHIELVNFDK